MIFISKHPVSSSATSYFKGVIDVRSPHEGCFPLQIASWFLLRAGRGQVLGANDRQKHSAATPKRDASHLRKGETTKTERGENLGFHGQWTQLAERIEPRGYAPLGRRTGRIGRDNICKRSDMSGPQETDQGYDY